MTAPKRVYLAGPMTGRAHHNFPAFFAAAQRLQQAGLEVVNPADNFGSRTDLPRSSYVRVDVALLLQCDAVAMLEGWEQSQGALLEYLLARELGLPVLDAQTLRPLSAPVRVVVAADAAGSGASPTESILDEAKRLTSTDRQSDYGHPRDDFARAACMWSGILAAKLRPDTRITAMDVPLCMIAIKLARQAYRHKRDNLVDIAGYARTAALVAGDQ